MKLICMFLSMYQLNFHVLFVSCAAFNITLYTSLIYPLFAITVIVTCRSVHSIKYSLKSSQSFFKITYVTGDKIFLT